MIDLLPRGGSIHVDGGHSLPVVVLCCVVVVLPVFERAAVCVVPVLVSLIFSVHGGHSLPVVWMCVFHGGHSLPDVGEPASRSQLAIANRNLFGSPAETCM